MEYKYKEDEILAKVRIMLTQPMVNTMSATETFKPLISGNH